MANTTGTFSGATDLLNKINTFVTANGWTRLQGDTDIVPASPKTARYWRILILDTQTTNNDFRSLRSVELRATSGGANVATTDGDWAVSNDGGTTPILASGGTPGWRTSDIDDNWAWARYDFGAGQIVREAVITCHTDDEAPLNFLIQWSNDDKSWMTMDYYSGLSWSDGETKTFTWDAGGGFTAGYHVSSTIGRRSGWLREGFVGEERNLESEGSENYWTWQGPGYDADRRTYIHAISFSNSAGVTDTILFDASVDTDQTGNTSTYLEDQDGGLLSNGIDPPCLALTSGTGTYWAYVNSTRLVVVCKNGVDDYTAAYAGFMAAFAQPDDYPFPLYVGATHNDPAILLSDTQASYRDFADPGRFGAYARLWDNTWVEIANHDEDQGLVNDPRQAPDNYTWPYHSGTSARDDWPNSTVGDFVNYDGHWLDRIEPTDQGDLPLWPVIPFSKQHGCLGALDGVFSVPQGGVLSPEQVLTIATVDYRVFRVRDKSGGMVYWAVRED